MSDTPRTDSALSLTCEGTHPIYAWEFARTLERELAAARAELATARECLREAIDVEESDQVAQGVSDETLAKWRKAAGLDSTAGEVKA